MQQGRPLLLPGAPSPVYLPHLPQSAPSFSNLRSHDRPVDPSLSQAALLHAQILLRMEKYRQANSVMEQVLAHNFAVRHALSNQSHARPSLLSSLHGTWLSPAHTCLSPAHTCLSPAHTCAPCCSHAPQVREAPLFTLVRARLLLTEKEYKEAEKLLTGAIKKLPTAGGKGGNGGTFGDASSLDLSIDDRCSMHTCLVEVCPPLATSLAPPSYLPWYRCIRV